MNLGGKIMTPSLHPVCVIVNQILIFVITLVLAVPVGGIYVRWRTNYKPKVVQLEGTDVNERKVSNVFQMTAKVYRVEGLGGFYKGLMPQLLVSAVIILISIPLDAAKVDYTDLLQRFWRLPQPERTVMLSIACTVPVVLFSAIFLPLTVIIVRAITTPFRLPYCKPLLSLRILFTPAELRRPWIIYKTPGLFLTFVLNFAIAEVLVWVRMVLLAGNVPVWKMSLLTLAFMVCLVAVPPSDVIRTKLCVQRNDPATLTLPHVEGEGQSQTAGRDLGVPEYSFGDDVVQFREEPYTGLIDCGKKIAQEEGWTALFRLWWIDAILLIFATGVAELLLATAGL